jgi:hypothetical protein
MESFFAVLQNKVLDRQRWATREHLRLAIITWIERTYHRRWRQRRFERLNPVEYETLTRAAAAAQLLPNRVNRSRGSPPGTPPPRLTASPGMNTRRVPGPPRPSAHPAAGPRARARCRRVAVKAS